MSTNYCYSIIIEINSLPTNIINSFTHEYDNFDNFANIPTTIFTFLFQDKKNYRWFLILT